MYRASYLGSVKCMRSINHVFRSAVLVQTDVQYTEQLDNPETKWFKLSTSSTSNLPGNYLRYSCAFQNARSSKGDW